MNKLFYIKILNFAKKIKSVEYLGGKCKICGNSNYHHLEFHHIKAKNIEVSRLLDGYRWSKIKNELDRCILFCSNCHQEYHFNERNSKDNRQLSKKLYLEYKSNTCERCGYDKCQASLTFHHKDPNVKEIQFGNLSERYETMSDLTNLIKEELDKCEVLCNNCHREEHTDIEFFNKHKDIILEKSLNLKELSPAVDVNLVMEMYNSGFKQVDIRKKLNVAKSTISGIIKKQKGKLG